MRGGAKGIRARPTKIAQGKANPPARGAQLSRTPPGPAPVCGGKGAVDGYDYRLSGPQDSAAVKDPEGRGPEPPSTPPGTGSRCTRFQLPRTGDGAVTRTSLISLQSEH